MFLVEKGEVKKYDWNIQRKKYTLGPTILITCCTSSDLHNNPISLLQCSYFSSGINYSKFLLFCLYFPPGKPASAPPPPTPASSATDGSTYQTTEYYGYNDMSFYDLESEMLKFRQTQPDPQKPPPTPAK